ncbi:MULTISPECIES: polynucleotide kinase-phosphatase [unclassified Crossiella]|uniref:polynucleotide kinase-phosphatase n=1 Tax=unclassified Crossiella TaxID=2620835 RepID=UPI001FFE3250|nr:MULTISPECIES: polynucleotide kinase-phosphatase [unclassified Crossiella]MCK2237098.1 polynucleotide kinase-phosphatase [Crossiella sp. S99.2]MCK2250766.1 polynucleotide kinase-phosphatase [Crossiella sp. S99.1]
MTELSIPDKSLVLLIGVSGAGKSSFAAKHFKPTQVLSSDYFRGLVSDDENSQEATADAFDALNYVAGKRLAAGLLTVVDATNVQPGSRAALIALAKQHHVLPVGIVLDVPEAVCVQRNAARADRTFGADVIARQRSQLRRSQKHLVREGLKKVHTLHGQEEIDAATIVMQPLINDRTGLTGPFDVIGDVHGCRGELESLLINLGWNLEWENKKAVGASHPEGRIAVFVGDLVDRGPDTPGVLRLVMNMVEAGTAICVCGNHEQKLHRALTGRKVTVSHGLAESLDQLAGQPKEFQTRVAEFCYGLVSHYLLDGGNLVIAHAGLPERFHGRASGRVRSFALYGDTTGETDEYGLPVRYPWANDYRGQAMVLYGHTPTPEVEWVNNTMCLDTGAVFGNKLTALRYPEREIVSVPSAKVWYEPTKPLIPAAPPEREPDLLELSDVAGKRVIETKLHGRVTVTAEHAAAALEVMSRFALDPRWLLYLPPTMAPVNTSAVPDLLEHPAEAFTAYLADGVRELLCEEKHMGSRAVVLVCRDEDTARKRFGVAGPGVIHTRTGRDFFADDRGDELLAGVRDAIGAAGLWAELDTDWLLLDAELLPWSAKAGGLIREQYAAVGAAATAALPVAADTLRQAAGRGLDVAELLARTESRLANAAAFDVVHQRYCWPTDGLDGLRLAPFQLLASEGRNHAGTAHAWHLAQADKMISVAPGLFTATRTIAVDAEDPASVAKAVAWWEELTATGGEGMVVKPAANVSRGKRGLVQPGLKVRGREYLRLIYGPDYTEPANLQRVRQRKIAGKRSLALREYALGMEGLDRLAAGEPLWRVHECVFAVLALESEPVDPRL